MHIFLGIFIIFIIIYILLNPTGGDAVFPIIGNSMNIIEEGYLYIWNNGILGSVVSLNNLRSLLIFIFSKNNLFSFNLYLFIIFTLGFIFTYISLNGFFKLQNKDNKNNTFIFLLSLFYIFNPLTVSSYGHYLILQGYFLIPIFCFVYVKTLISKNFINIYLIFFLLIILFLGQPHNYYNIIIIALLINIILLSIGKINIYNFIKKNLFLLLFSILCFSQTILTFFGSIPNDLTSSVSGFGGEPNMVWSGYQGLINTIIFKSNYLNDYLILKILFLFINSFLFFFSIFIFNRSSNKEKKLFSIIMIYFIFIISLSFIGKNPLFSEDIKVFLYSLIPHLRIDISYIILIYVYPFLLFIGYSILKRQKNTTFINFLLIIQIGISLFILFIDNTKEKNIIDKKEYLQFNMWLNNIIDEDKSFNTILFWPMGVTYNIPGITKPIYPTIFVDKNFKTILHWNFLEISLNSTRKFLSDNKEYLINDKLKLMNIKYILCFNYINESCKDLKNNKLIIYHGKYNDIYLFKSIYNNYLINSQNLSFQKQNPTKYTLNLKNISSSQDVSFLQSFHKEWKLYLKQNQNASWCKPLETYNNDGKNITECEHKQEFFQGEELSYLYKKPLFENTHQLVYDYANGWTISKNEIIDYVNTNYSQELQKENYPKQLPNGKLDYKYYTLNSDGSIDAELTLYFKPQSYFYLGLIISGTTFILLIGYLSVDVVRNRRRKEEEKNQTV